MGHLVGYYGGQQLAGSVKERDQSVCFSDSVIGLAWLAQHNSCKIAQWVVVHLECENCSEQMKETWAWILRWS
jgi:hypothetical protein